MKNLALYRVRDAWNNSAQNKTVSFPKLKNLGATIRNGLKNLMKCPCLESGQEL